MLALKPDERVLDVGCGIGRTLNLRRVNLENRNIDFARAVFIVWHPVRPQLVHQHPASFECCAKAKGAIGGHLSVI